MNIIAVYVFPNMGGQYIENACRFIATYNLYPAEIEHRLIIVSNGGEPTPDMRSLFPAIEHPAEIVTHDNSGYDIGAEQAAAAKFPCDMMVFFGSSAYIRGAGWLRRMAEAFREYGPENLYGCMGNGGNSAVGITAHIRTTGYFLAPLLMNVYPMRVTQPQQRYPFEHGPDSLTQWFLKRNTRALVVTWKGVYDWPAWNTIPGGMHRGHQEALLTGDRLTCPPFYHSP